MKKQTYQKVYNWFMARPLALFVLRALDKALTLLMALCYGGLLVVLGFAYYFALMQGAGKALAAQNLLAAIACPAFVYVAGSLLRKYLNLPRPYEQEGFVPLVAKQTQGKSCPSRHALCAAVLAATWWAFVPQMGAVFAGVAVVISALRVLSGVHSVRDVVAGLAFGGVLGALGMLYVLG